jgi:hypothetical protein
MAVLTPGSFIEPGMLERILGLKITGIEFDEWTPPESRQWIGLKCAGGEYVSLYIDASGETPSLVVDFHPRCEAPARDGSGAIMWRCQLRVGHAGGHR